MGTTAGCSLKKLFYSVLPLSSSWRWQRRRFSWLVDTFISVVLLTGWVWHGSGWHGPLLNLFRNLPWTLKISLLDFLYSDLMDQFEGSWRLDDHQWKQECSTWKFTFYISFILKSRLNSTGYSAGTSEFRDVFDRQTHVSNDWWQLMCSRVLQPWDHRNSTTALVRNITKTF